MARSIQEVAIAALARREHTALELRRKLQFKGFAADDVESVITQLIDNNLLSEERFTESYINMRKRRGYGPVRIEQELRERGVDDHCIDTFLQRNDAEWWRVMREQYSKKYGDKQPQDYADKAKRAKYLQARGFPLDWVFKVNSMEDFDY